MRIQGALRSRRGKEWCRQTVLRRLDAFGLTKKNLILLNLTCSGLRVGSAQCVAFSLIRKEILLALAAFPNLWFAESCFNLSRFFAQRLPLSPVLDVH